MNLINGYIYIRNHISYDTYNACKIDILFPPNGLWVEYYGVNDLRDIITIMNKKKKMLFMT